MKGSGLVFLIISASFMVFLSDASAFTNVTDCSVLDSPGENYQLIQDISTTTSVPCIVINSSNISLDCNNHSIIGSGNSWGIYLSHSDNITVINCKVFNFSTAGIEVYNSSFDLIENNEASNQTGSHGIVIDRYSQNNTIRNNICDYNQMTGLIAIEETSAYNLFINNTARYNQDHGMEIEHSAHHNYFINNTISNNRYTGIKLSPGTNQNLIQGNNLAFSEGQGINIDNSSSNIIQENDISHSINDGINIGSNSFHNAINRNTLLNTSIGISLVSNATNITIANNTLTNIRAAGIFMDVADNVTIDSNEFIDITNADIQMVSSRDSIAVYNNTLTSKGKLLLFGNLYFNSSTYGNHWSSYDEPSEGCEDSNSDGICDSYYTINSNNIDYFPIALNAGAVSNNGINNVGGSGGGSSTLTNKVSLSVQQTQILIRTENIEDEFLLSLKEILGGLNNTGKEKLLNISNEISKNISVIRNAIVEEGTLITTKIRYSGDNLTKFIFYDIIPKTIAESSNNITIDSSASEIRIIKKDPEYLFIYDKLANGDIIEVNYTISKRIGKTNKSVSNALINLSSQFFGIKAEKNNLISRKENSLTIPFEEGNEYRNEEENNWMVAIIFFILAFISLMFFFLRNVKK